MVAAASSVGGFAVSALAGDRAVRYVLLAASGSAMHAPTLLSTLVGAAAVLVWRLRETASPTNVRKLLIPPLGMSTGLAMFAVPEFRVPVAWAMAAFLVGALVFSYPLIHTSTLVREGDAIWLKRSRAFLVVLLVLLAVRLAARNVVERYVSLPQTGALFFLLAFGMLLPWRVVMYLRYRKLSAPVSAPA